MNLDELLEKYDREEATRRFAEANDIALEDAEFLVAIALGKTYGDVYSRHRDGAFQSVPSRRQIGR